MNVEFSLHIEGGPRNHLQGRVVTPFVVVMIMTCYHPIYQFIRPLIGVMSRIITPINGPINEWVNEVISNLLIGVVAPLITGTGTHLVGTMYSIYKILLMFSEMRFQHSWLKQFSLIGSFPQLSDLQKPYDIP